jgi:hypothetical protein
MEPHIAWQVLLYTDTENSRGPSIRVQSIGNCAETRGICAQIGHKRGQKREYKREYKRHLKPQDLRPARNTPVTSPSSAQAR